MADEPQSTHRWRLNEPYRQLPNPHMFDLPPKREIRRLQVELHDENMGIRRFARRPSLFPGLSRYSELLTHRQRAKVP